MILVTWGFGFLSLLKAAIDWMYIWRWDGTWNIPSLVLFDRMRFLVDTCTCTLYLYTLLLYIV